MPLAVAKQLPSRQWSCLKAFSPIFLRAAFVSKRGRTNTRNSSTETRARKSRGVNEKPKALQLTANNAGHLRKKRDEHLHRGDQLSKASPLVIADYQISALLMTTNSDGEQVSRKPC